MTKGRIEAFSDGVLAIAITIMVLELKVPHTEGEATLATLRPLLPVFSSYVLSFIYIGIYWNNHHHLFHATRHVNGAVLWANLHLLFWLSLIPFVTGWMGENHFAAVPTALYGIMLLMAAIAYTILQNTIMAMQGANSLVSQALGSDVKGKISLVFYIIAIPAALMHQQWISDVCFVLVALLWLIPDKRIERVLYAEHIKAEGGDAHSTNPLH